MATYYSAHTSIDYKTLLNHFKDQADGNRKIALLPAHLQKNGSMNKLSNSIVVLNKPKHVNTNTKGEKMPAIRVLDDTEAARLRAERELQIEEEREEGISDKQLTHPHHKTSGKGARQTSSARKRPSSSTVQTGVRRKVKRVRDVFDQQ